MESQYLHSALPVISNNDYCPIVNPFQSTRCGFLKILLAMGSDKQLVTLIDVLKAATTIQKIYRGYTVRKQYKAFKRIPIRSTSRLQESNTSLNVSSQSSVSIKSGESASPKLRSSTVVEDSEISAKKVKIMVLIEAAVRLQIPIESRE